MQDLAGIKDSVNYYTDFTTQTSTELLTDAQRYLSMKKTPTHSKLSMLLCVPQQML